MFGVGFLRWEAAKIEGVRRGTESDPTVQIKIGFLILFGNGSEWRLDMGMGMGHHQSPSPRPIRTWLWEGFLSEWVALSACCDV